MRRLFSRQELSRTLLMYGAFWAAGKILDGDDAATLRYLEKLRTTVTDRERAPVIDRVMRDLRALAAAEAQPA